MIKTLISINQFFLNKSQRKKIIYFFFLFINNSIFRGIKFSNTIRINFVIYRL